MLVLIYYISKDIKVRKYVILRKVWGKRYFYIVLLGVNSYNFDGGQFDGIQKNY